MRNTLIKIMSSNRTKLKVDRANELSEKGKYDLISNSEYFDKEFYLSKYIDIAVAEMDPVEHYLKLGWKEGRKPSDGFDLKKYCISENLAFVSDNPLVLHEQGLLSGYLFPKKEESYHVAELELSGMFDAIFYNNSYLDVKESEMNPVLHFVRYGWREGRFPNALVLENIVGDSGDGPDFAVYMQSLTQFSVRKKAESKAKEKYDIISNSKYFDEGFYLSRNIDVATAEIDPVEHYLKLGWKEGRKPSDAFDLEKYSTSESLSVVSENPLILHEQGLLFGYLFPNKEESYQIVELERSNMFDASFYNRSYSDVKGGGINPILHFVRYGWREGRFPNSFAQENIEGDFGAGPDFTLYMQNLLQFSLRKNAKSTFNVKSLFTNVNGNSCEQTPEKNIKPLKHIDVLIIVKNYHLASALWRATFLNEQLRNNSVKSMVVGEAEATNYIDESTIIIFQKFPNLDSKMKDLLEQAKRSDAECWYDIDDAFLPEQIKHCGQVVSGLWSAKQAEKVSSGFIAAMKPCKRILASTPHLVELLQELLPRNKVYLKRNRIPLRYFTRRIPSPKVTEPLRLIYPSGSMSHKNDFELVAPVIEKYLKKFKDSTLTLLGGNSVQVPDYIKNRSNVICLPRMSFEDMLLEFEKHDLVLAPLELNQFNDAKSNIKFIEAAAAKTPILTTSASEFSAYIEDGKNGFIEDNFEKWHDRLVLMRKNGGLLKRCGEAAYEVAKQKLSTLSIEKEVLKVIKDLTKSQVEKRFPNKSHQKYPNWYLQGNKYISSVGREEFADRVNKYIEAKSQRGHAKYVVYTCLSNNYDSLKVPEYLDPEVDYVCFSDRPIYGYGIWQLRGYHQISADSTRTSRHPKILPQKYLAEYDSSIYIDANYLPTVSLLTIFKRMYKGNVKVAGVKHPWRDCLYEEAEACRKSNKDSSKIIDETITFLKKHKFPEKYGLFENNLIYRQHNDEQVANAMNIWWDVYARYSRRDQLSYMFALYSAGITPELVLRSEDKHVRNSAEFAYFSHGKEDIWKPIFI
jgi:glycosyltransferase involved in cell wall biosynthesis